MKKKDILLAKKHAKRIFKELRKIAPCEIVGKVEVTEYPGKRPVVTLVTRHADGTPGYGVAPVPIGPGALRKEVKYLRGL